MGIQKVEKHLIGLLHIHTVAFVDPVLEIPAVRFFVPEEIHDGIVKGIIHDGIKLIPPQPAHGILPDFTQDIKVRAQSLQTRT